MISNYQNKSTIHNLNKRTQLILKVIIERHLFLNHDLDLLFYFRNPTEYIRLIVHNFENLMYSSQM